MVATSFAESPLESWLATHGYCTPLHSTCVTTALAASVPTSALTTTSLTTTSLFTAALSSPGTPDAADEPGADEAIGEVGGVTRDDTAYTCVGPGLLYLKVHAHPTWLSNVARCTHSTPAHHTHHTHHTHTARRHSSSTQLIAPLSCCAI